METRWDAQGGRPVEPKVVRSIAHRHAAVVGKILYLRQHYHFGPGKIADYMRRFHQQSLAVLRASDPASAGVNRSTARSIARARDAGSAMRSRSPGSGCSWM
jgi:hypothetical protein